MPEKIGDITEDEIKTRMLSSFCSNRPAIDAEWAGRLANVFVKRAGVYVKILLIKKREVNYLRNTHTHTHTHTHTNTHT